MSNLRELLNPESPERCSQQSTANGDSTLVVPVPAARRGSSPNAYDRNPVFIHDPLYNLDSPYNLYSNSSLAEDAGHPHHENCPDSLDCLPDTDDRPQHTLPVILRCAILGSAKRRLTIRDIYAAMENKYPYYRTAGPAWKQSVRHHLSLSRLFERKAKPVTEPGFGSYWTVNLDAPPGTKRPRKRGRHNKNASSNKNGSPASTETSNTTGRRGRPKKNAPQDFEFEQTLGIPSTATLHMPTNDYPALHAPTSTFATFQLPTNDSSQQYRLHSVHDLPSPNPDQDDDDEMFDAQDHCADGRSPILSDDAGDSIDEHSEEHAVYPYSGDPRTLPPPSLSSVPVDPGLVSSYNESSQDVGRLREEVRGLRRQAALLSAAKVRMTTELSDAHAEIARLRARNELLERGTGVDATL